MVYFFIFSTYSYTEAPEPNPLLLGGLEGVTLEEPKKEQKQESDLLQPSSVDDKVFTTNNFFYFIVERH